MARVRTRMADTVAAADILHQKATRPAVAGHQVSAALFAVEETAVDTVVAETEVATEVVVTAEAFEAETGEAFAVATEAATEDAATTAEGSEAVLAVGVEGK